MLIWDWGSWKLPQLPCPLPGQGQCLRHASHLEPLPPPCPALAEPPLPAHCPGQLRCPSLVGSWERSAPSGHIRSWAEAGNWAPTLGAQSLLETLGHQWYLLPSPSSGPQSLQVPPPSENPAETRSPPSTSHHTGPRSPFCCLEPCLTPRVGLSLQPASACPSALPRFGAVSSVPLMLLQAH